MRKKVLLIALTLCLNIFAFNLAEARPQYCEDALDSCLAQCDRIFGWPVNEACRAGCWIGNQSCGTN